MPLSRSRRLKALIARPFAHRGLHGGGLVENSRAAFEAAIAAGDGIEFDVQASADGQAMVFHDYGLERLTSAHGRLAETAAADLGRIALNGAGETIPTLEEVLTLIGGRAGLLIEVKSPGWRVGALCRVVADAFEGYDGPVAVMSFNPAVPRWFAHHAPDVLRGLVVMEEGRPARHQLRRRLALHWSRADFLAYDIRDLPSRFAVGSGLPVLTWTVRTATQRATAAAYADQIIHEMPRE